MGAQKGVWVEEPSMGPVGPVPWVLMGTVVVSEGIIRVQLQGCVTWVSQEVSFTLAKMGNDPSVCRQMNG